MSQQKKKLMRRKLAQAFNHQKNTIELIMELAEIFGEFHTDYHEYFLSIAQNGMITLGFIKDIATQAWGYFPENIDSWLR